MSVPSDLLLLTGVVLVVATFPLLVELLVLSVAALFPQARAKDDEPKADAMPITVLIPAHNEEALIGRCIRSVLVAANAATEVRVVAHNCTDDTAVAAEAAGAKVSVLNDPSQTGKGFALSCGFTVALAGQSQAVLVIDADSVIDAGLIRAVRKRLQAGARAVQCRYEVHNSQDSQRTRLMTLAFCGVNVIRPRGRARLGLSAGILGNGFALHRQVLTHTPYHAQSVVEDLEYHLDLVRAGIRVEFIDSAAVRGEMPVSTTGARAQRARWEGGRLRMMRRWALKLLGGVFRGHGRQIEPLLDLLALPIALEVILLLIAACLPLSWLRLYALAAFAVLQFHITAAAIQGPGFWTAMKALSIVPSYILWKLWIFPETWRTSRLNAKWVRTQRASTVDGPSAVDGQ
jgi:cellulose synthase/poly-beta-1,6-N-acetylglucosamine synthase-like glycosyltransferase